MTNKGHTSKKILLLVMGLFLVTAPGNAQTGASLTDFLVYGLANNPEVQKAGLATEQSEWKVKEVYSALYPQIKGNVSIMDNLKLQTSILPGEIIGAPGTLVPVQFGTQYNATAGIDASQILFDPGVLSGVRMANQSIDITALNKDLTEEQLLFNIAQAYYAAQITATQKAILENNLKSMDTLALISKVKFEADFILKTDYDRVLINQANLRTEIQNLNLNYEKQLGLLKYYSGMPMDSAITVASALTELEMIEAPELNSANTLNMRMLQMQNDFYYLNIKQVQSGYIPNVSLSFRYAYMAMQDDLNIFGSDAQWYPMSYLTLNVNIPIFDGFAKSRKVQQIEIDMDKNLLDQEYTKSAQEMQYQNALNNLKISTTSLEVYKQNIELAEAVYQTTKLQFQNEISSLTDLLNVETSRNQAQSNYMAALIQIKIAQLELLKSTGNIKLILQ